MPPKTVVKSRKDIYVPNSFPEYRAFTQSKSYTQIYAEEAIVNGSRMPPDQFIIRYAMALAIALNRRLSIEDLQNQNNRIILLDLAFFLTINAGGKISGVDPENIWQISFIPKRVNCERIVCKMDGTTPVSLDALFVIPSLLFSKIQMNSDANLETYTQLEMYGAVDHTAMTTDFLQEVAIPVIEKTCDKVHVEVERTKRGFWPGGDGYLLMRVYALRGGPLNPITTPGSRGKIVNVYVLIFRSGGGFPKKVEDAAKKEIEEQLQQFKTDCGEDFEYDIQTSLETHETAYGAGFGVIATAESKDSWIFGAFEMADLSFSTEQRLVGNELKVAAENEAIQVSTRAINRLKHKLSHNSCIDDQMQSHLLVYMALAAGKSKIFIGRPTLEFLFAKYVVEKTLGIEVRVYSPTKEPNPSQSLWMVTCEGVGYFQGDEIGGFNTNRTT